MAKTKVLIVSKNKREGGLLSELQEVITNALPAKTMIWFVESTDECLAKVGQSVRSPHGHFDWIVINGEDIVPSNGISHFIATVRQLETQAKKRPQSAQIVLVNRSQNAKLISGHCLGTIRNTADLESLLIHN